MMGMLNSLHHYFMPALSPATFNVATIVARAGAHAGDGGGRSAGDLRPSRSAPWLGGVAQILVQWRALHARRIPLSPAPRLARSRPAADPRPDGARHDRSGGDPGESVRQHAARDGRRHRRGVVADLRLPADVPADRTVRRVDRDRRAAGGRASCGARRSGGGPADGGARPGTDARAERAGHDRPDRSRRADCPAAVRARAISPLRHRGRGRGASLLRHRA